MQIMSLLVAGLLASLLPSAAAETPKRGGMLTFAVMAEAPSTDCHAVTTLCPVPRWRPALFRASQGRPRRLSQAEARCCANLERLPRRSHLHIQDSPQRALPRRQP